MADEVSLFKDHSAKLLRLDSAEGYINEIIKLKDANYVQFDADLLSIIDAIHSDKAAVVEEAITAAAQTARLKAIDARTPAMKLSGYEKAVKLATDLLHRVRDPSRVQSAITALRAERDGLAFDLTVQKAETEAAKGKLKKAIELYIEASIALKHDTTPDEYQHNRLAAADRRISELNLELKK